MRYLANEIVSYGRKHGLTVQKAYQSTGSG